MEKKGGVGRGRVREDLWKEVKNNRRIGGGDEGERKGMGERCSRETDERRGARRRSKGGGYEERIME